MSGVDVGTAFVRILPDMTGFNAALTAGVGASSSMAGAAAGTKAASASSLTLAKANLGVASANATLLKSQMALNAAMNATVVDSEKVALAEANQAKATAALTVANERLALVQSGAAATNLTSVGSAGNKAADGVKAARIEGNILRGSLIGLSRITPVTVFGLTLWGTAAIGAGLAVKSAIKSTAEFEHQLYVLQATTGATADEMKKISELSKQLGADLSLPSTSAGDAAKAMTELAKAGLTIQDTMAGARGVLELSAAANIDVSTSATFVANALNAFGLQGSQATHVADLLAGASIAAQGEIADFGAAMQQVSAVSKLTGLSLETTTGALTELARAGLKGADAGTSLRTGLLRLAPTTKQATEYMNLLGIKIDKTKSIGEQLPQLLDQYKAALNGLSPVLQEQILTQIAGQDAIRGLSILIEGGSRGLRENTAAANQNGAAQRLAAANAKGLSGAWNGLKSSADTLGINLGKLVSGPLEGLVRGLGDTISLAAQASQSMIDFGDSLGGIKIPTWLTGEKGKDSTVSSFFKGVIKGAVALGPEAAVAAKAAVERNRAIVQAEIDRIRNGPTVPGEGNLGGSRAGSPANTSAVPGEGMLGGQTAAQIANLRRIARIEAAAKLLEQNRRKQWVRNADTTAPNKLVAAELDAVISGNLRQEVAADTKIIMYFRDRLKRAIVNSHRYVLIKQALSNALSNQQSALEQIKSDKDAADQKQQTIFETNLGNQRTILEMAAEAANNQGAAEQKLIAFYRQQTHNAKLTTEQQLVYAQALRDEQKKQTAAIVQAAKDEIDRRTSLFDLRIQQAELTPSKVDDKKWVTAEINYLKGLQAHTKNLSKEWISYESQITSLKSRIKGLSGSSGFSINDLFKEALTQFNEFGSNVSSSPMTPGGVRGQLGGNIARNIITNPKVQKDLKVVGIEGIDKNTDDAAKYMKFLYEYFTGNKAPTGTVPDDVVTPRGAGVGHWTAAQAKAFAKVRGN